LRILSEAINMAARGSEFQEFVKDRENQRALEQESLALQATELISRLMDETGVTKAELAHRIGKSRAFVTQLLSGSRNMTMHTLADLAFALGYTIDMKAVRLCKKRGEAYDLAQAGGGL
jgi:transcriptional regulator with XRE-family HTH domain